MILRELRGNLSRNCNRDGKGAKERSSGKFLVEV